MASERLPPWRKTGNKADPRHFEGLGIGSLVEFSAYDDRNRQQGRVLGAITGAAMETYISGGRVFEGQVLAIEDGYYQYWFEELYGKLGDSPITFFHFCDVPVGVCKSQTAFRNPIHVDVFRLVNSNQAERLAWLNDSQKAFIKAHPVVISGKDAPGSGRPPASGDVQPAERPGQEVETGLPGVEGLARALGSGEPAHKRPADEASQEKEEKVQKKKNNKRDDGDRARSRSDPRERGRPRVKASAEPERARRGRVSLRDELDKKKPPEPHLSALDFDAAHRKKKKEEKSRKKRRSSSSTSKRDRSPSSSSSGSLFRSAALPRGLERLRRMHQKDPGKLASISLQRLQELVVRAQGRGTATSTNENLPAVAMGYLSQVFLVQNPPSTVAVRTVKEMRTVAIVIDHLCSNDPLRALDILVQRLKALELAHRQQSWVQASQLELVLDEDMTAVFRPELKAAQSEVKEEWKMQRGPLRTSRPPQNWGTPWVPSTPATDAKGEGDSKDTPPSNQPKGMGKKGRGKGKKGRFGRR